MEQSQRQRKQGLGMERGQARRMGRVVRICLASEAVLRSVAFDYHDCGMEWSIDPNRAVAGPTGLANSSPIAHHAAPLGWPHRKLLVAWLRHRALAVGEPQQLQSRCRVRPLR